jgi:DNA-binding IclR family transcriptional regulator
MEKMTSMTPKRAVQGTQAVARALQILELVSERTDRGHLLAELVTHSGLTRPTVHRLLAILEASGLVEQDNSNGRWHLGPECQVLGALAARRYGLERLAQEPLSRIATLTGETAFLSVRRGEESVCVIREEGTFPIRTHVLQAGDRLPLGVGSAGIAMLAGLPDVQVGEIIDNIRPQLKRRLAGHTPDIIRRSIAEARELGYSINRGLLLVGSWGMAAAIRDEAGVPIAALSITAIQSRIEGGRQAELGRILMREAKRLGRILASSAGSHQRSRAA